MAFQDLIIVIWALPDDIDDYNEFLTKCADNRYGGCMHVVGDVAHIRQSMNEWWGRTHNHRDKRPPTTWMGFQGTGWHLKEFHDIINLATTLPALYPGINVEWLPDNWFDHEGLVPELTGPENALEWLEQQVINAEPEIIQYDYKGAPTNERAPF